MTPAERFLAWFLRLTGAMLLVAALAVVMPTAWMRVGNDWLGLPPLPEGPLIEYLTRSLSALYAALGACYWYVARDVRRYLPLLRFSVPVTLVFSGVLVAIDLSVAMPRVWFWSEGPFLLIWTAALWWLVRRASGGENG